MRNRKLNINNFSTFTGKIELSDKISTMLQLWWKYGSSNILKWNIFCCSSFFNTVKKTVITDPKQYCKKKNKNCNRFNNKHLANIYLFKTDNKNTRKRCENMLKVNKKDNRTTSLTSNIFHIFFYCFYCWLWTTKCKELHDLVPLVQLKKCENTHGGVLLK